MNGFILKNIFANLKFCTNEHGLRETSRNILEVPFVQSTKAAKRISILLPKFINGVIRAASNLNFTDFKKLILQNINIYFTRFLNIFCIKD